MHAWCAHGAGSTWARTHVSCECAAREQCRELFAGLAALPHLLVAVLAFGPDAVAPLAGPGCAPAEAAALAPLAARGLAKLTCFGCGCCVAGVTVTLATAAGAAAGSDAAAAKLRPRLLAPLCAAR